MSLDLQSQNAMIARQSMGKHGHHGVMKSVEDFAVRTPAAVGSGAGNVIGRAAWTGVTLASNPAFQGLKLPNVTSNYQSALSKVIPKPSFEGAIAKMVGKAVGKVLSAAF